MESVILFFFSPFHLLGCYSKALVEYCVIFSPTEKDDKLEFPFNLS